MFRSPFLAPDLNLIWFLGFFMYRLHLEALRFIARLTGFSIAVPAIFPTFFDALFGTPAASRTAAIALHVGQATRSTSVIGCNRSQTK